MGRSSGIFGFVGEDVPAFLHLDLPSSCLSVLVELCLREIVTVGPEVPVDVCYIAVEARGVIVAVCHYCR